MLTEERSMVGLAAMSVPTGTISGNGLFPKIFLIAYVSSNGDLRKSKGCAGLTCGSTAFHSPITTFTNVDKVIITVARRDGRRTGGIPNESLASMEEAGVSEGKLTATISAKSTNPFFLRKLTC